MCLPLVRDERQLRLPSLELWGWVILVDEGMGGQA